MQITRFLGASCEFDNEWEQPKKEQRLLTDDDWIQKGKENGIEPRTGEPWHEFKRRVSNS